MENVNKQLLDAAKALESCNWSGVSIGNKAVIAQAVKLLQSQAITAAEQAQQVCRDCNGTGRRDSGGVYSWGAPIMVQCDCRAQQAAPYGYALVPIEPTRAMLDAAKTDLVRDGEIDPMLKGIYRAMLAAAMEQPK